MKKVLHLIISILPWQLKRRVLSKCFGFNIHKTAYIGLSVVNVGFLKMAAGSRIGHFNFIRSVTRIDLEESATVGNLNWITGAVSYLPMKLSDGIKPGLLHIGRHSAITNRHYIDCSGGFQIGQFSILAGVKTTLFTHSINIHTSNQNVQGIVIGNYCFVGTSCVLLLGSHLPDCSVLAAGSILTQYHQETHTLYAGNPAKEIKKFPRDAPFFSRERGHVD